MAVEFELNGQRFVGINGGPQFTSDEAVSFRITCDTSDEVDRYWERLTEGGAESLCGWPKYHCGLSWQVVPAGMAEVLGDPDPERLDTFASINAGACTRDGPGADEGGGRPRSWTAGG